MASPPQTAFSRLSQSASFVSTHASSEACKSREENRGVPASSSGKEAGRACWSCGDVKPSFCFLCKRCNKVQPPEYAVSDGKYVCHYELLGMMPPRFDVDTQQLDANYRELMMALHPDKHGASTPAEQEFVSTHSANLSEAHRVLKDPVKRASYLLELLGMPGLQEEERVSDMSLMMEMLEADETVEEAEGPSDPQLLEVHSRYQQRFEEARDGLYDLFRRERFDLVKESLLRLQMYQRLLNRIKERGVS